MLKRKRARFMGVLLMALVALGTAAYAIASTSTGAGQIRGFDGVQVTGLPDFACTSSLPFEDMPGMSLRFTLLRRGAVVVLFQGQFGGFSSTADNRVGLRFTIDGAIVGSAIAIGSDPGAGLGTFGYNAYSIPLKPGTHTAKVLWHTFPTKATSCVEERSLIVLRP